MMNDLLSTIYSLYPRGLKHGSLDYFNSLQHIKLKKFLSESCNQEKQTLFLSTIKNVFNEYHVNDFTSDDYWSFEFIILLNKIEDILDDDVKLLNELGGVRKDAFIYISKISKYYYYTFSVTRVLEENLHFEYEDLTHIIKKELLEFNSLMKSKGYFLLDVKDISQIIPDVETELAELGQAKVFDLLFTDLYSHTPYEKYD